jgi:ABC-type phosphate/phosphonate transport system ATPase subunit
MKRTKPLNRAVGIDERIKEGRWRVRWVEEGKLRYAYRQTKEAAEAHLEEMRLKFTEVLPAETQSRSENTLTRKCCVDRLWAVAEELLIADDPVIRIDALKAANQVFRTIREELQALEVGTAKPDDASALSDDELEREIVKLRSITGGKAQ